MKYASTGVLVAAALSPSLCVAAANVLVPEYDDWSSGESMSAALLALLILVAISNKHFPLRDWTDRNPVVSILLAVAAASILVLLS